MSAPFVIPWFGQKGLSRLETASVRPSSKRRIPSPPSSSTRRSCVASDAGAGGGAVRDLAGRTLWVVVRRAPRALRVLPVLRATFFRPSAIEPRFSFEG
jgi:hypothetical protein